MFAKKTISNHAAGGEKPIRPGTCARRALLALLLSTLPALVGSGRPKEAETPPVGEPRLNVLFIAVDDMRDWAGYLGSYKGEVQTPNIDRLASRGVAFTNAHCASPLCNPSRTAIMTGLMPSTSGIYDNSQWWKPHLPDAVTIPVHFRSNGYRVAGSGKIFHHTAGNNPPYQWDDYRDLLFRNDPWFRASKQNYPWSKSGPFPPGYPFSGVEGLGLENDWGSLNIEEQEYDDALTVDFAGEFLTRAQDRPFFLACGIFRPHLPWYVPRRYFDLYPLDAIRLPDIDENDLDDIPGEGLKLSAARRSDFEKIRDAGRWKHAVQAYLASISFADAQLGRLLDALDRSAYRKNTVVVLWSDHGWHLGEKSHWHKGTLWEEATRVPFLIVAPGVTSPQQRCSRPVSLVDIFPTLIDLCGLGPVPRLDGKSLLPLLRDPSFDRQRPAIIQFGKGLAAIRSDRYRYIRYSDGTEEFYDHDTDPHEWKNLAKNPKVEKPKAWHAEWVPRDWAPPAPGKKEYQFDPDAFIWKNEATGAVTRGK